MKKVLMILMVVCLLGCGGDGDSEPGKPATKNQLTGNYSFPEIWVHDSARSEYLNGEKGLHGGVAIGGGGKIRVSFRVKGDFIGGACKIEQVENNKILINTVDGYYWLLYDLSDNVLTLTFPGEGFGFEGTMTWRLTRVSSAARIIPIHRYFSGHDIRKIALKVLWKEKDLK